MQFLSAHSDDFLFYHRDGSVINLGGLMGQHGSTWGLATKRFKFGSGNFCASNSTQSSISQVITHTPPVRSYLNIIDSVVDCTIGRYPFAQQNISSSESHTSSKAS